MLQHSLLSYGSLLYCMKINPKLYIQGLEMPLGNYMTRFLIQLPTDIAKLLENNSKKMI